MKKWQVLSELRIKNQESTKYNLVRLLLKNRGILNEKEVEEFLNPDLSRVTSKAVGIDQANLKKAVKRIGKAIKDQEQIIVFGDYDVDGICASAILWETLNNLGAKALPYIPSRFEEGYGLSTTGISNLKSQISNIKLIITVDNGIVANDAVEFARKEGIDVIVTDHHVPSKKLPNAFAIVHTTNLCGAGVAYLLAQEFKISNLKFKIEKDDHLSLVVLATIADLVPLTRENRILTYFGLRELQCTKRPGLLALIEKAGLRKEDIGIYEIGHMLAPRLNAMGRLESAMDSLRLICTNNKEKANSLANLLNETNLERQRITMEALVHAKGKVLEKGLENLIFIADESYQQGVVGLVAGRLVEEFYLPSIVISKGKKFSKASVRSVKGFNVIEFLRTASDLLVDVGGHPMAAGFTVETDKIELLQKKLFENVKKLLTKENLERVLRIDLELKAEDITLDTWALIQQLSPFGMANPEPTFLTKSLMISDLRVVGKVGRHLSLELRSMNQESRIKGIYFGAGEKHKLKIGDIVDVVYTLECDEWNDNKRLQLKIKDIKSN